MNKVERLIKYFAPESYKLELGIDKNAKKVTGTATIRGEAKAKTIKLHAKDLNIETIFLNTPGENKPIKYTLEDDILMLQDVGAGQIWLTIAYNFELNDQMRGVYLSHYEHDGKQETIVTTQFESHYAREAFPCVDEPEAKATFDVTITTPDVDDMAIGNMPIKNDFTAVYDPEADYNSFDRTTRQVEFETTPRMSTYLLAFVLGKFQKKSTKNQHGVEVNVYASLAQKPEALDFALDAAARTLDFYDDYFGVPYPLPKSDQVALPDFDAGAMENWGLVTYREAALLVDPAQTSIASKRWILTVITHELSHQWFGNLVTMKWWDDLWLNESFASVVEYIAADALYPEWNMWQDFLTGDVVSALKRDSLDGVQAVHQDVSHPDEIQSLFDGAIVYAKGARLIYMLINLLGEDKFKQGMKRYFEKFAHQNTSGDDLWETLSEFADFDVKAFMGEWINKPGYPVLSASYADGELKLSQKRFLTDPSLNSDFLWPIPLGSFVPKIPKITDEKSQTLHVVLGENEPLQFNHNSTAHFITNYDDGLLDRLLNFDLSDNDALALVTEQSLLAGARQIKPTRLFKLVEHFKDSQSEPLWDMLSLAIGNLKVYLDIDTPEDTAMRRFVGTVAEKQFKRLGLTPKPGEPEDDTKLRVTILAHMIYSKNQAVIDEAIKIYDTTAIENIDKNLRACILFAKVLHDETPELIKQLVQIYKTTSQVELRQDVNYALCSSKNPQTIDAMLANVLDNSVVRLQDKNYWIIYLLRDSYSREKTWQFLRDNWSWFEKEFSGGKNYDDFPRYVASVAKTDKQLQEYKDFFSPKLGQVELTRNITIGIKEIENRVELIKAEGPAVSKYLLNLK